MPNWEQIRKEWETSDISFKEMAEKYHLKDSTIRSRKNREKWQRNDATQRMEPNNVATPKKRKEQKNRSGNPNPENQFTKRNSAAVTHGLFAKYLPQETLEIVSEIDSISPLDILWMNIKMQFAQIMRAQQIMHVEDKHDMTQEVKKTADGDGFSSTEYEIQFAWDKQANFLNSQSRAMGELRSMLKQFYELANADDDRLLEIKRIEATIEKAKSETEFTQLRSKQLKGTQKDTSMLDALVQGRQQYEQMMKERENNE